MGAWLHRAANLMAPGNPGHKWWRCFADGQPRGDTFSDHNGAWCEGLRLQPFSWDYARRWHPWTIEEVDQDGNKLDTGEEKVY